MRGPTVVKLRQYGHQALHEEPWIHVHLPSSDQACLPWPADVCTGPVQEPDGIHMSLGLFLRACAETPLGITTLALGDKSAAESSYPEVLRLLFKDPSIFLSAGQIHRFTVQLDGIFPYIDRRNERPLWRNMYWEVFFAARALVAFHEGTLDKARLSDQVYRWVDPLYRDKMFQAWTLDHGILEEVGQSYGDVQNLAINKLFRDILFLNPIELT